MSNSGGKIKAPVSIEGDVMPVLGETTTDLQALCTSSKINKWSYIKPIQDPALSECSFSIKKYKESISRVFVYCPNSTINSADYTYLPPHSNFRLLDFDGYNHNSFAAKCDVAGVLPSNIDFDNCIYNIPIELGAGDLWSDLLVSTPGDRWENALLLVCKKGNYTHTYRTERFNRYNNNVILSLGSPEHTDQSAYKHFKSIGIADYTVDIMAIAIPETHPDKANGFIEITDVTNYQVYPLTNINGKIWNPLKKGVRISNPKPRTFWEVSAYDAGNQTDGTYIPEDALIGGDLMGIRADGGGVDLWYEPNGIPFKDFINSPWGHGIGGIIARGSVLTTGIYTKMKGNLNIYYYEFNSGDRVRPVIISYGAGGVVNWLSRNVNIKFDNLTMGTGDSVNAMTASFYFVDPNFRPV